MWGALKWESLTRDRPITHRFPSGFAVYPPAPPHGVFARANSRSSRSSARALQNKGVRRLPPVAKAQYVEFIYRKRLMMVAPMVVTNCGERFTIAAI